MRRITKKLLVGMLISGLILVSFAGCSEDEKEKIVKQPPSLPPDSSMSIDFSTFGGGKLAPGAPVPGKNFRNASGRVLLLDVAVKEQLLLFPIMTIPKR